MKIGLISINMHTKTLNFACPLHTYAFQQFLSDNNIDSTIIDYRPVYDDNFDARHPLFYYLERGYGKGFYPETELESITDPKERIGRERKLELYREGVRKWVDLFYEREVRYDKFQEFIEDYYKKTDKAYTTESLEYDDPGFDCYICVTDVIWKYNPGYGFDRGFFLASKTMEGKGKIAYAASRGPWSGWKQKVEQEFKGYIQDFDCISVRESSLKEYIETVSEKKAEIVLDPVLLQNKEFYHKIAVPPKEKKYVLLYDVMEKARDSIIHAHRFAQANGLELIEITDRIENAFIPEGTWHKTLYDIGVEEWLGYIENAEYVFTNSFHACCFSIIFEKEFFVGNRDGDKIDHLLESFGLTWRRLTPRDDLTRKFEKIDYEPVRSLLEQKKKASAEYILSAIQAVEKKRERVADQAEGTDSETDVKAVENGNDESLEKTNTVKYYIYYHSGITADSVSSDYREDFGKIKKTPKGAWEYKCSQLVDNSVPYSLRNNYYFRKGHLFLGWYGRITVEKTIFWYCTDGRFHTISEIGADTRLHKHLFLNKERIHGLPFEQILKDSDCMPAMVMEAVWKPSESGGSIRNTRHMQMENYGSSVNSSNASEKCVSNNSDNNDNKTKKVPEKRQKHPTHNLAKILRSAKRKAGKIKHRYKK